MSTFSLKIVLNFEFVVLLAITEVLFLPGDPLSDDSGDHDGDGHRMVISTQVM